uniref:Uncharacterized protein n=1 Tax=Globodera rostochiensis TaxID=31243 RepID=A0A914I0T7_GLORO
MDDIGTGNLAYEEIGREINEGLQVSGKPLDERLIHLAKAEEMILKQDEGALLCHFVYREGLQERLRSIQKSHSNIKLGND